MKKKLLFTLAISALLLPEEGTCQNTPFVETTPTTANRGVIAFSDKHLNGVEGWRVVVNRIDGTTGEAQHIQTYDLHSSNYVRLNEDYFTTLSGNQWFEFRAQAINNRGGIIGEEIIVPAQDNNGQPSCEWGCEGDDYAFRLVQTDTPGGGYKIYVAPFYQNTNPVTPFYRYMSETEYQLVQNLPSGPYQHFLDYHNIVDLDHQEDGVIKITNANPGQYEDLSGNALPGPVVYGVQKTLGEWAGPTIISGTLAQELNCNQSTFLTAINMVNGNYDFSDPNITFGPLYCAGAYLDPGGSSVTEGLPSEAYNCLHDYVYIGPSESSTSGETWSGSLTLYGAWDDYVDALMECAESDNPSNNVGSGGYWNDDISEITIVQIDEPGTYVTVTSSTLFDSQGSSTGHTFTTPQGLYEILVHYTDGSLYKTYIEQTSSMQSEWKQANFIDILAAPNPVTGNEFNILMSTEANVDFRFELISLNNGTTIFEDDYTYGIQEDISETIRPARGFRSGYYVGRFTFSDGSSKTITIEKN